MTPSIMEATAVSLFLAMAWETVKIVVLRILNAAFPSGQKWFFLSVTWSHFAKNIVIFWLLAFMYILLLKIALTCPGLSKTWYQ